MNAYASEKAKEAVLAVVSTADGPLTTARIGELADIHQTYAAAAVRALIAEGRLSANGRQRRRTYALAEPGSNEVISFCIGELSPSAIDELLDCIDDPLRITILKSARGILQ